MKVLDRLPVFKQGTSIEFRGRYVTLHRSQILVWVSVQFASALEPDANAPRFPALMDTGNHFGFSIRDRYLREWAGIDARLLKPFGQVQINEQVVGLREAAVWLSPNIAGRQDAASDRSPYRLEIGKGIAVYAPDADPPGPRLPLLGLPALLDSDLDCWHDPERRHVTVQTRSWRRRLIRLLCRL